MFNLAIKKIFEKNLPFKVYGNLNSRTHFPKTLLYNQNKNTVLIVSTPQCKQNISEMQQKINNKGWL